MMQTVPGSERWYCRVVGCDQFARHNIKYGYCDEHTRRVIQGESFPSNLGFPPPADEHQADPARLTKIEGSQAIGSAMDLSSSSAISSLPGAALRQRLLDWADWLHRMSASTSGLASENYAKCATVLIEAAAALDSSPQEVRMPCPHCGLFGNHLSSCEYEKFAAAFKGGPSELGFPAIGSPEWAARVNAGATPAAEGATESAQYLLRIQQLEAHVQRLETALREIESIEARFGDVADSKLTVDFIRELARKALTPAEAR